MQCAFWSHSWCKGLPACRVRPHDLCQRMHDSPVHAQLAQAALPAGHCHQQCIQHASYGAARPLVVCRAHHSQMGSGNHISHLWPVAHIQISQQPPSSRTATAARQSRHRPQGCLAAVLRGTAAATAAGAGSISWLNNRSTVNSSSSSSTDQQSLQPAGTGTGDLQVHPAAAAAAASAAAAAAAAAAPIQNDTVSTASESSSRSSNSNSSGNSRESTSMDWQLLEELGKRSYRMIISYDGTAYSGWQLQVQEATIQAHIERALSTVLRESRKTLCVCAAGRTDAGVHARGQVVQFYTNSTTIDPQKLPYKLNSLLPHDIRVLCMSQTAPDFIVTMSALRKTYHYQLDTGRCHDPLRHRYSHHCRKPLDYDAMRAAAGLLVGTHDFTQFSNTSELKRNPVKTLERFDVVEQGPAAVRLEVQGTGFLYKQVRHMTGALLAVGEGTMGLEDIMSRLEVGRSKAPGAGGGWRGYNVAPGKGLQLFEVEYPAAVDDPQVLLYPDWPHDEFGRLLMRVPGASSIDEE